MGFLMVPPLPSPLLSSQHSEKILGATKGRDRVHGQTAHQPVRKDHRGTTPPAQGIQRTAKRHSKKGKLLTQVKYTYMHAAVYS